MAYGEGKEAPVKRNANQAITKLGEWADAVNVAEDFKEEFLDDIASQVVEEYEIDCESRSEWEKTAKKAQARADQEKEDKTYPFENASNVKYPLLITAALQFAARAYAAIIPDTQVVKSKVVGKDEGGEKRDKGDRVASHMSFQLLDEMPEWEEDTDTLLHQIPVIGCAFRKIFYDPAWSRNRSEMVSAFDFVVNQSTKSLETVPRATHRFELYPHQIDERVRSKVYLDQDYMASAEAGQDDDAPQEFLEQHRFIDLDGDGYREPWIVTVHFESKKVARIVANYDPDDLTLEEGHDGKVQVAPIQRRSEFVKYPFLRDHKGGFYDVGFGKLLENISETIDSTINQMMDAGNLQNAGGGFIGSGLRLKKAEIRQSPGKYHMVQAAGGKIRDSIYNMEHPGPSPVLFQLLTMMVESGERLTSVQDILTGELARNQTATTTLAMIEQGLKVYTSIYKRIYRALAQEFKILFRLNAKHLPEQSYYTLHDDPEAVFRADYDVKSLDIVPVSDPNMVTDMQRLARAQLIAETQAHPVWGAIQDPVASLRRYYDAAGIEDMDELIKPPQPDPMQQAAAESEIENKNADTAQKGASAEKDMAEARLKNKEARLTDEFESEMGEELAAAVE